ncbi:PD-(D/E)XK nuclease family protein [Pacificispira sp.]|uniref:PD-(D/E)XK nuclease family protein n=1 Tax=Pacificispira sp. TaxID=2888761 RepID=UPI003B52D2D8
MGLEDRLPKSNGRSALRLSWQKDLDRRDRLPVLARPAPTPPAEARPSRLSATRIELLMRDPYSIYAQYVLRLDVLDPLEADLGAADKGTIIHRALDAFTKAYPDTLPDDAEARLLAFGEEAFGAQVLANPAVKAFWWPRYIRIAQWFLAQEGARRARLAASHTEIKGSLKIPTARGAFTLSAEADRIDLFRTGGYAILDYKTGFVPSKKSVADLTAPQLPLEAAILKAGGFPGVAPGPVVELSYWKLSGGDPPGSIQTDGKLDADALAEAVAEKLTALVQAYELETTPYPAVPRAELAPRFNDYAHLARIKEMVAGHGGRRGGRMSDAATAPKPDPDLIQRRAADPKASVWVAASAGSGKTKVLTDRVLALLVDGAAPDGLLCVTFTKAAASEMANRIHRRLSQWTRLSDAELENAIRRLDGGRVTAGEDEPRPAPVRPGSGPARRAAHPHHPFLLSRRFWAGSRWRHASPPISRPWTNARRRKQWTWHRRRSCVRPWPAGRWAPRWNRSPPARWKAGFPI